MRYRQLGRTKISLSAIGMGTARYTGGDETIRLGLSLGVNFIDTAERYGTESVVGRAVAGWTNAPVIGTKVRHENLGYDDVMEACRRSILALGVGSIDLLQVHRPNPEIPFAETFAALSDLVDAGLVGHIGVCNFSVAELVSAQAVCRDPIVSNQVRYNLVDRHIEAELIAWCAANGVTVIAYSPLARGSDTLVSGQTGDVLAEVARREGGSIQQVSLAWCLRHDNVVVIPRTSSPANCRRNCEAAEMVLSPHSLAMLDSAFPADATPEPVRD